MIFDFVRELLPNIPQPEIPAATIQQFTGRSLVTFVPDATASDLRQFIRFIGDAIRRNVFMEIDIVRATRVFDLVRAAVIPVNADILRQVMALTGTTFLTSVDHERAMRFVRSEFEDVGTNSILALEAMGVTRSPMTGRGVIVAILDSGVDRRHPDLAPRILDAKARPGLNPNDPFGHGTHSIGLACGPQRPVQGLQYGVASEAQILSWRVLDDIGFFTDADLIDGMEWATLRGASVISMALGGGVAVGSRHSEPLDQIAGRISDAGVLLIAAAGNSTSGAGNHPVNHPANCPSIMAVGAVGPTLQPLRSSCVQINPDGEVNFAAPGSGLRSAVPRPHLYGVKSGTSQATSYAAGIAALWAQRGFRGRNLMTALRQSAMPVSGATPMQVGAGILQAPR